MPVRQEIGCPPGNALISMKPQYGDLEGSIYIPRNAPSKAPSGRMGRVEQVVPWIEGVKSWIFVQGKLEAHEAWRRNQEYIDMLGKYVICKHAKLLAGEVFVCRFEYIESIVPENAVPPADTLGRCTRCKSKGGGNILLGPDGYCPICGFNLQGKHQTEEAIDITEEMIDHMVRIPMEIDHMMKTGGKAVKGTVISYPGQEKRGSVKVADSSVLNAMMKHLKGK